MTKSAGWCLGDLGLFMPLLLSSHINTAGETLSISLLLIED